MLLPSIVFASSTYEQGRVLANRYIYDFTDYARYIKLGSSLPFGIDNSNKPVVKTGFNTGGFLNEKEFTRSLNNGTSYLAPGIGYWLMDNKILDVKVSMPGPNPKSGVRITEFVKHDVKVKGSGTKTNPWYFTDGYSVKITSTDQTLGTITGGCDHVEEGGNCTFTVSYDAKHGIDTSNCEKVVSSKGATFKRENNIIKVLNVKSDISCFVDFGKNSCVEVTFNNQGGTGGMAGKKIYYKYGYGWFSDGLCLNKVASVSRPTKSGNRFNAYIYNGISIIDPTPRIVASVKSDIFTSSVANASWTPCGPGKYLNNNECVACPKNMYSIGAANPSCTSCPTGYTTAGLGSSAKAACKITCQQDKYVATVDAQCTSCPAGYHHDGAHTVDAGNRSPACSGNEFTVKYHGNGATGGSMADTSHIYGSSSTLRQLGYSKTGYTFKGWATSATGGVVYGDQADATRLTTTRHAVVNLYAVWRDETPPTCTVAKSNTGTQSGVTFRITCSDNGSGCPASSSFTRYNVTSSQSYVIYDNAGNARACDSSQLRVSSYNCNPYNCNPYDYVCDSYDYQCGSYICGSHDYSTGCYTNYVRCMNYCANYCSGSCCMATTYDYCPSYCTRYIYCTAYHTCYNTCYN